MNKSVLKSWQLPVASVAIACGLAIAIAHPVNLLANAQTTTTPSSPSPAADSTTQKLLGQWQSKAPSGEILNLLFTPDGKLLVSFIKSSAPEDRTPTAEVGYRIDPTPQPMHIDLLFPGDRQSVMTIFEFTKDGQLRLEISSADPGKPRPKNFSAGSALFQKVADSTSSSSNTPSARSEAPTSKTPQTEAIEYVSSTNKAQVVHHLQKSQFATNSEQLAVKLPPETENYRYQIVPQNKSAKSAIVIAQSKKTGLKSYTGAVFNYKNSAGQSTLAMTICETNEPTSTPPGIPQPPKDSPQQIKCADGSSQIQEQ
ncbi:MAG: hypothetical protein KME17_28225 [Cyanosarcina radialis HA8281-LM2]|nr:hypothetical protein [Cyanosarcina radialis HA8281-LM2]